MHPMRQQLAHDLHRPHYHYLPPANWLNDPNGLIQWNGVYHLFYQYNPNGAYHHKIHWGHAVSRDLVHWADWPIALTPTPGEHDQDGCWSGCIVNNNDVPTLFYTGVYPQVVCTATSADNLLTWHKYPGNPLISGAPPAIEAEGEFRDPYVWREPEAWYMLMGSRHASSGGVILLYRSEDLLHWDYLHPLLSGDKQQTEPFWTGTIWECPNLFRLGDRHILVVSFQEHEALRLLNTGYFVGDYQNQQFTPTHQALVDYGDCFYAPQVMVDEQERRLMWGWLREGRSVSAQRAAGWSGVMSLPRMLSLRVDGLLGMEPAPELKMLRARHHQLTDVRLTPASTHLLNEVQGDCLEIMAEFELGETNKASPAFGLKVRCSPDEAEQTLIGYDHALKRLEIQRDKSSLDPETDHDAIGAPFELTSGETLRLHIFLDRSVVEVFANGWACLTARIYPTRRDSLGIKFYVNGANVILKSLNIWQMRSIWEQASEPRLYGA